MSDWQTSRLEELAAPTKSAMSTGPFGSAVSSKHFQTDGVPMLRGSNLSEDVGTRLIESNFVYLNPELALTFERSAVKSGDLIFTCWGTVGQIGIIEGTSKYDRYILSNKQMKFTPDQSKIEPLFLYYFLSQPSMLDLVKGQAIGSTIPGFNLGQLKSLPVKFPSPAIQCAIAEVLGALDDKFAANTALVDTADMLAGSLTRQALDFSDRVPLSSIATLTMGSSPVGDSFNESGEGAVFYQGVRDFGVRYPTNRVWTSSPVRFARSLDSLLSVRAPVGKVNLASEETCIGRGLASVRSKEDHPYSLFHLLKDDKDVWAPYEAEGTVFGSINKSQLESLMVPVVRSNCSQGLEEELTALERRIASALRENDSLAATRDALLPQLMSGNISVRDAETLVEVIG